MSKPVINKPMPKVSLPASNGETISLDDFSGKNIVLYFYPRDNTPGCTQEGKDFTEQHRKFSRNNTVILGVSRDSVKKHINFKEKYQFTFELLADEGEKVCKQFGLLKDKTMFGKLVKGVERTTYLIDSKGILRQTWNKVKVDGHVDEVLAAVKALT